MSKEQTPITAEEIKRAIESGNVEKVLTIMERYSQAYAQAKVLEALEREVPKAYLISELEYINATMKEGFDRNLKINQRKQVAKEYYETEVKTKYQNK